MSFYAWRWSPSDEDFVPEARFLTQADGEAYIAEFNERHIANYGKNVKVKVDRFCGVIAEEKPGDRELFETYQKARKQLREYWRATRERWRLNPAPAPISGS